MDQIRALEIIRRLADGVDPFSGEVFPSDSPYQNADVIRALHAAIGVMEAAVQRVRRTKSLPERAGRPWSEEESSLVVKCFEEGVSIPEIAKKHKRTNGAIRSRLVKLGKISKNRTSPGRDTA
jgi:hypothetical protein